eukprot:5394633-Pyramimonas_sp.AAC.1
MITELKKQANLGKTMTDIFETAKGGTFEDLVDQRRPDLQAYEPPIVPAGAPPEEAAEEPPAAAMDEETTPLESRHTTPRSVAQPEAEPGDTAAEDRDQEPDAPADGGPPEGPPQLELPPAAEQVPAVADHNQTRGTLVIIIGSSPEAPHDTSRTRI